jgi:hypothetical protein
LVPATILSQRYPEVKILNRRSTADPHRRRTAALEKVFCEGGPPRKSRQRAASGGGCRAAPGATMCSPAGISRPNRETPLPSWSSALRH